MTSPAHEITRSIPGPPGEVVAALAALSELAHSDDPDTPVELHGRCVVELALGIRPTSYTARVDFAPDRVLDHFPNTIAATERSRGLILPTPAGPIDLETATNEPTAPRFRVETLRWDPGSQRMHGDRAAIDDLDARRLGLVSALAASSTLSLEAARWIAEAGFQPAPGLASSLAAAAAPLEPNEQARARHLLKAVLLGRDCAAALAFLLASRFPLFIESKVDGDAPSRAAHVPAALRSRLAALLIEADARVLLRALHFGGELSDEVFLLLAWHPIDLHLASGVSSSSALRRFARKARSELVADAISIRRAQAACATKAGHPEEGKAILQRLDDLESALTRAREERARKAIQLALDGRAVMQHLGLEPGREVGRAIAHLSERVARDPSLNTAERLREALDAWASNGEGPE